MRTEADLNRIAKEIIGAAIAVHRVIGPGCFESAYVACLALRVPEGRYRISNEGADCHPVRRTSRASRLRGGLHRQERHRRRIKSDEFFGPTGCTSAADVSPLLRMPARPVAELRLLDSSGR